MGHIKTRLNTEKNTQRHFSTTNKTLKQPNNAPDFYHHSSVPVDIKHHTQDKLTYLFGLQIAYSALEYGTSLLPSANLPV